MFGVSMWEILIVLVVLVALVGPGKIPELAKSLGKALGSLRRSVDEVKKEVNLEEELDFLKDVKDVSAYDLLAEEAPSTESVAMPEGPARKEPVRSGRRKVRSGKKGLVQAVFGDRRAMRRPQVRPYPVGPSGSLGSAESFGRQAEPRRAPTEAEEDLEVEMEVQAPEAAKPFAPDAVDRAGGAEFDPEKRAGPAQPSGGDVSPRVHLGLPTDSGDLRSGGGDRLAGPGASKSRRLIKPGRPG